MCRFAALLIPVLLIGPTGCGESGSSEPRFSFFVTSVGTGEAGGDIGGLAGADAICQDLQAPSTPGIEPGGPT